jgi:hypothetical protein
MAQRSALAGSIGRNYTHGFMTKRLLLPLMALIAVVALPAPSGATQPEIALGIRFDPLECLQTTVDVMGAGAIAVHPRGTLDLLTLEDKRGNATAAEYTFRPPLGAEAPGTWTWNGRVGFADGPLSSAAGFSLVGTAPTRLAAMPNDPIKSRTFPLVLRSTRAPADADSAPPAEEGNASFWYCGAKGYEPSKLLGAASIAKLKSVAKVPIRIPGFFRPREQRSNHFTSVSARIRAVKRGLWRVELTSTPCPRHGSCSDAIFEAHRLSRGEKAYKASPVTLAGGIRGQQNDVGCGVDPNPSWAPVYCGQQIVTWVRSGIEYAVQMTSPEPRFQELIRYANAMIRGT